MQKFPGDIDSKYIHVPGFNFKCLSRMHRETERWFALDSIDRCEWVSNGCGEYCCLLTH